MSDLGLAIYLEATWQQIQRFNQRWGYGMIRRTRGEHATMALGRIEWAV